MRAFELVRPASVAEASAALSGNEEAKLIAGGQTLIPSMKHGLARPSHLVDLAQINGLRGIRIEGNNVVVGAMTPHAEVAQSPEVRKLLPALAHLAAGIGDRMVRNLGTIGGSIANNDPAADYPAAVLGLGATVVTSTRRIAADEFFTGMFATALQPSEIITSIEFPVPRRAAYSKFRNPASRYAIVGVFVAQTGQGVRVAVTGAGACVFRLEAMEKALAKTFAPEVAEEVTISPEGLNSDIHASADFRAHLVSVVAARSVRGALETTTTSSVPTSAISVREVTMRFGAAAPVLAGISFDVREGEFLCIVGPSGCGKTTLLRLLAGLARPSAGSVEFFGERIQEPARDRAIVFQDYSKALLPWRTVSGNVSLSLEACGVPQADRKKRIDALLAKMSLSHAADRYPNQLSGGMQQRVQIARCLAQQPRLLLMDEPFGALDAITRQALQDEVARLAAETRTTVVFITHDLEEAIYLGDRVIVLAANPGRVAEKIVVGIPRPRSQLETREDPKFLAHRHRLFGLLQEH